MAQTPAEIVVVGSCNVDLVTVVPRLPVRGETLTGTSFGIYLGGKGLNQAVAARRCGAAVAMVARVGHDDFGARVRSTLDDEGIMITAMLTDEIEPTGTALITVEEGSGENNIVVVPGANGRLTRADVTRAINTIQQANVVLLQLEIPFDTVVHTAHIAHASGAKVVLTPAPAQPLPPELLAATDVLLPNQVELSQVLGADVTPREGARALIERGCQAVVVTLGSKGALLVTADDETSIPAIPVQAVDTVAAGDAFAGALAALLAQGSPLAAALRYATAAGALAVTKAGALPSLPTRAAIEQLLNQQAT